MVSYEEKIEKALQWLKEPSHLSPTGFSPIVYLVYQPEDVMTVRNIVDVFLVPKANYMGFKTHFFSFSDLIDEFVNNHEYLEMWTDSSVTEQELYNSIKQEVDASGCIEKALLKIQEDLANDSHSLLILRDVEMLHPFNMMGVIENKIYNQIHIPILVLYPGETIGKARSFLGYYNQDGNYRSINI